MLCVRCQKTPDQLQEYVEAAAAEGLTPNEYVWQEEGTLNRENGHFLCTDCYIKVGQPAGTAGHRWVAP